MTIQLDRLSLSALLAGTFILVGACSGSDTTVSAQGGGGGAAGTGGAAGAGGTAGSQKGGAAGHSGVGGAVGGAAGSSGHAGSLGGSGGSGATGGSGGMGGSGAYGGTGAMGGYGGTGAMGGYAGTGAMGGYAGAGAMGGYGGTGAMGGYGGSGGTPSTCKAAYECGDTNTYVCDPKTRTCAPGGCSQTQACANPSDKCIFQASYAIGACYSTCTAFPTPTPGACSPSGQCTSLDFDPPEAVCLFAGTGAPNTPCSVGNVDTGCVAGYQCIGDPSYVCRQRCDFWGSPSCSVSSQHCLVYGFCSETVGDTAALGANCSKGNGTPCAPESSVYRGLCVAKPGKTVCGRACRVGSSSDCDSGQTCKQAFSNLATIGTCE